ncbi:MAG: WcaF family extracellular polysaccharide biosynthesis acetyltransferase [Bryobacteraceae bacterium]|nr:WcaF family extracellular polysaccharide biosynthesis acetyltransferase [Bryobacteraceae bacterium]
MPGKRQSDLRRFDNSWYEPGASVIVRVLWFFFGAPLVRWPLNPSGALKRAVLRLFGAVIGAGVVLKPGLRVKYPWRLKVGEAAWIGEGVWIDNLADVEIGAHACLSQEAYLCTGNHDWTDPAFSLIVKGIRIGRGAWVGARALIGPGVDVGEHGIASMGSVVLKDIPPFQVYSGNPAQFAKHRRLGEAE